MSGIRVTSTGSFNGTQSFLDGIIRGDIRSRLAKYGEEGVAALRSATPILTGLTAESWSYEITDEDGFVTLWWTNSHVINGFNVAIGLQYGHATGQGGWIEGQDYINGALKPIFDKIEAEVWKEVRS